MKKGKRAYSSDTPMEIRDRDELQREEEYLFDMYIENRYDERKDLSKINMDVLKKQIEDIY